MELTDDELSYLERAYQASTPGYWRRAKTDHLATIEDTRAYLERMVDFHPEQTQLEMLVAMKDASDPVDVPEDGSFIVPAFTGNGPTSEANAAFVEVAHNWMPLLLDEIKRSRALLAAFRPAVPR